eukprot:2544436-Prymnesium_polylepis.1
MACDKCDSKESDLRVIAAEKVLHHVIISVRRFEKGFNQMCCVSHVEASDVSTAEWHRGQAVEMSSIRVGSSEIVLKRPLRPLRKPEPQSCAGRVRISSRPST